MTVVRKNRSPIRGAFTLMELMVVIAIIVVLAGIGIVYAMKTLDDSKRDLAQQRAKELGQACELYKIKVGDFPNQLADLLQQTPEGYGPFLKSEDALRDPWDQPYEYNKAGPRNNGTQPDIWTVTSSGIEVGNWPKGH
jgi:general secretion pathway protein G